MTTLHVDTSPALVEVGPGQEFTISVRIANLSPLIDGYTVRVFGLDAAWMLLEPRRLSLFPSDSGTVDITVTLPADFPAGMRMVSVYVQSENAPTEFVIAPVTVDVTSRPRVTLSLDPAAQTAGKRAQFGMVVMNHGNSIVEGVPDVVDPEEQAEFEFTPPSVRLLPGERDVIQVGVTAPRPWVGPPKVRVLNFAVATSSRVETMGTFMQRPRISRWLITVLGLIAVAALFAAVLSRTLSNVVAEAKVGDQIIEQALANDSSGPLKVDNPASVKGAVLAGTSGAPITGVQVALFAVDNPVEPVKTSASGTDGQFRFAELPAGVYRIRFSGAGFAESWYGGGRNFAEGRDIELSELEECDLATPPGACLPSAAPSGLGTNGGSVLDGIEGGISLVGLPGSVSGTVTNDDPVGATATLVINGITDPEVDAVVASVAVSANGAFELNDVPTPQLYTLVVERYGNATETRTIDLGPGAVVEDLEIALRIGDGLVSGTVTGAGQPFGGALVEATDGQNKVSTVSLTQGAVGTYALRNLAVPGVYTITVTAPGFAPASQVIELTENTPQRADANVFLSSSQSGISGTVRDSNGLLGGVIVTATGPDATVVGATESEGTGLGSFLVAGLPTPASYTVTFSKPGYVDQVRQVTLDPLLGPTASLDVLMNPDTVVVRGRVLKADGSPAPMASVSLTNGTFVRSLLTTSQPASEAGAFAFSSVPAGSYTFSARLAGTEAIVFVVNVTAGQQVIDLGELRLGQQASIFGTVTWADGAVIPAAPEVRLYLPDDFPPNNASVPVAVAVIGPDGSFEFLGVEAPQSFVIAVFSSSTGLSPLASDVVKSQPGVAREYTGFVGIPGIS